MDYQRHDVVTSISSLPELTSLKNARSVCFEQVVHSQGWPTICTL